MKAEGYAVDRVLGLHAWGDHFDEVHPELRESLLQENEEIEKYIMEKEWNGYRIQLIVGQFGKDGHFDKTIQSVTTFAK